MSTKFSFEVPIAHLNEFDEDQDFYFSLSFLYDKPEYYKFMMSTDKEMWIDNSTNELKKPDSCSSLANLLCSTKASRVVAPDHPDWNQETMLNSFTDMVNCDLSKEVVVVVIHHPDWIGHFKSYGIVNFAVPYDFRYCTRSKLKRFSTCHFLGLLSIQELLIAKPPTCDTSIPIKLALLNKTLDEWIKSGCPHIHTHPEFFSLKLTSQEIKLSKQNIKRLKEALTKDDPVNHPKHYTQGRIEVLDFIQDQNLPYLSSTVLKYICRYRYKNGVEDLKKAEYYLRRLIDEEDSNS